jgi:hypothetical protein
LARDFQRFFLLLDAEAYGFASNLLKKFLSRLVRFAPAENLAQACSENLGEGARELLSAPVQIAHDELRNT